MQRTTLVAAAAVGIAVMLAGCGGAGRLNASGEVARMSAGQEGGKNVVQKRATVGAYYFDGWAGSNRRADDPNEPWARNAPVQLTRRMVEEFPDREPVWGWRDDSPEVMERQIDVAADNGLDFFAFCWYWHDNGGPINEKAIREDPKHSGMELFMQARNNNRMKFCLLVANHRGFEIKGADAWKQAADFWIPYFKHPRYMTVGGKPLVIIFDHTGGDRDGFAYMQEAARKAGLPGVAIAGCHADPSETAYTHRTHYNLIPGYTAGSVAHPYSELVKYHEDIWGGTPEQPYMPAVIVGWDKRPWERPSDSQRGAWYFPDRTPEQFAAHVRRALAWMDANPDKTTAERIIMIYAWNEYGEGGYLAPTKGNPEGRYLMALREAVKPSAPKTGG
jgi:hypothetical protein